MNAMTIHPVLAAWNALPESEAARRVLPCNGSEAWAAGMAARRPLEYDAALFEAADEVWASLTTADRQQAFDSHPRIGEQKAKAASEASLKWSSGEQSGAGLTSATQSALADANRRYEAKFGRIYIVCATGKSAEEMLVICERRLLNDPETELAAAAEQQRQITQLRLRKWLAEGER